MTVINSREDILTHENEEYIKSRPLWELGQGRIPDLSDYRKLSVDSMEEAMLLARLGQVMAQQFVPTIHNKPNKLFFTQSLILGASLITRPMAERYGLDFEKYRSVLLVCCSRYGKSYVNALSLIIHAGANGEECQIGAATMPKCQIIQGKVVEMLPETTADIQEGLIIDGQEEDKFKKIKRLSTQVSKDSLKWTNGGSIGLFSTNEAKKNADVQAAGAVGIGGEFCVIDELQLMTPVGFRTASRFMVESPNTKRFCVGNPSITGHFKEMYDDPATFVVHMNDVTTIIEGRMDRRGFELTGMPAYSQEYRSYVMCVDEETEALTRDGWKGVKGLEEGELIAQINDDETLSFAPILHKIEHNAPIMLKTSFAKDDWMFTPEHRQYIYTTSARTGNVTKRVIPIKDLPRNSKCRIFTGGKNRSEGHLTAYDKVVIALQADGSRECVHTGSAPGKPKGLVKWRAGFTRERKINHFKELLEEAQIEYRISYQNDGVTKFSLVMPNNITKLLPDYFGWDIPGDKAEEILEELMLWDGCKSNNSYSTVEKRNADWVQAVATQCGKRSTCSNPTMWNGNTIYIVHIHKNSCRTTNWVKREELEWNKPVYCVTVPSGQWVIRRHGHVMNTGNCEWPDANSGTRFFPTLPELYDEAKSLPPLQKYYFIGIDSAYRGGDSLTVSLLSFNRGSDKVWFVLEKQVNLKERFKGEWDERTTLEICLDILKMWEEYNVVAGAIDIGFGIHIYEKMRDLYENIPLEPINYASRPTEWRVETDYNAKFAMNKRAELHLDLRDLSSNNMLYIHPDYYDEIVREMGEVGQAPAKQKIQIEAKKDIKLRLGRSPDDMDSLCLAIHAAVLSGVLGGGANTSADDIMEVVS